MSSSRLESIVGFRLVTSDLDMATAFYRDVLGFAQQGPPSPIATTEMAALGLTGQGWRQSMSIGAQSVALDHYETAGRPYPNEGDAASLWFQHLALVVTDMAQAYVKVKHLSAITTGGPQHLPQRSGGVVAFKFRDPEGHPLELLQFPLGAISPHWSGAAKPGEIGLGIDHSAISVADSGASSSFYADLGLVVAEGNVNTGEEQDRLDGIAGVEVRVTPLLPAVATPHLELLGYRTPSPRARQSLDTNDVAATRIVWRGDAAGLLRDPDGHLHQVEG